jgi:hypothetical protein
MKKIIILICIIISVILWLKYIEYENYVNEPYITVYAKGGLNNKLRVLLSYLYKANKENKKLRLFWIKNDACPDDFEKLFYPIINVEIINIDNKSDYDFVTCFPDINEYKEANYFKLLLPIDSIQKRINIKIKELNNNYIACHIRRTDSINHLSFIDDFKTDEEYMDFIDQYPQELKIYIATDCRITQQKFIDKYGDRLIYKKIEENNNFRQTSLQDAVVDMYVCAGATYFMKSGGSFSETITELRNN